MNKSSNSIKMLLCRKSIQYVTNNNIDAAFAIFNDHYLGLDGVSIIHDGKTFVDPVRIENKQKISPLKSLSWHGNC